MSRIAAATRSVLAEAEYPLPTRELCRRVRGALGFDDVHSEVLDLLGNPDSGIAHVGFAWSLLPEHRFGAPGTERIWALASEPVQPTSTDDPFRGLPGC